MATLNIGGQKVKVGDEFLSLPPEQQQEVVEEIMQGLGSAPPAPPVQAPVQNAPEQPIQWADVPGMAMRNTPQSAYNFGEAMLQPFLHPIDTIGAMGDMGAGALREGARAVLPQSAFNYIDSIGGNTESAERASATASAVGEYLKDRYGSVEGFKKALATDPIGVAGDVAGVLTGGEMLAAKIAGKGSKAATLLGTAANVTNPLTVVEKGAKLAGKGVGATTKALLGTTTGTSSETVGEAYRAARTGGKQKKAFTDNMRGYENQEAVIGEAKEALRNIGNMRDQDYRQSMAAVKQNRTPIPFQPIEDAFQNLVDGMYYNNHQAVADKTIDSVREIGGVLDEWSKDPSIHTAEGLDVLKRRIDDLMPAFSELNGAKNRERAVTSMRNAVKDAIVQQVPEYADAMKGYETASTSIKEIERSLSLGRKNSSDTALRKLQSITRNNANSNFGSRVDNAKLLEKAGADTIMPRLAGQSLNTIAPRGILKPLLGGGILAAASGLLSPAGLMALGALPLASPRLVGEAANLLGSGARQLSRVPKPSKKALLGARALGTLSLLGQD